MSQPLEGKVATIIDAYTIVLNIGREKGVKEKMKFAIITKGEINDPDSGKHLGTIDLVIAKVQIKEVYEKYSIAESDQFKRSEAIIETASLLESMFPISVRLPIADFDSSILSKKVKKGDIAKQITDLVASSHA